MDSMEYKGYRGAVRYSAEDRVLHGRILGIDDVVNFEGANVDELEAAFHEAVDDYIATCEKLGRKPARSYSGRIPLRIDTALHRRVAMAADANAKSVNSWIAETLESATREFDAHDTTDHEPTESRPSKSSRTRTRPRKRVQK